MDRTTPPLERAARRTDREPSPLVVGDCLIYTGTVTAEGYGLIKVPTGQRGGRTVLLHRLAYEVLVGPIPDGLELDHQCRRPACYNAEHLEPVTGAVNQQRAATSRPLCPAGHLRTPKPSRPGQTHCVPCIREASRRYRAKKAAA